MTPIFYETLDNSSEAVRQTVLRKGPELITVSVIDTKYLHADNWTVQDYLDKLTDTTLNPR